jgi:Rrf2 family protein
MKLQTQTMLALYSIVEAAAHPDKQIAAAEIAEKYGVSAHHLAKVLRMLGRAGFLDSSRGVGGGYRFAANSRRLTLMDVIDCFEDIGRPAPRAGETQTDVGRAIGVVLSEVDAIAEATFRSITIDTLLRIVEKDRLHAVTKQPSS